MNLRMAERSFIKAADLAEISPVRGCMVIEPWGWGIWENVQRAASIRDEQAITEQYDHAVIRINGVTHGQRIHGE